MEWIRTYPRDFDVAYNDRSYVVDSTPHVYMDHDYRPVLEALTDDTVVLEWDIAVSFEDRQRFAQIVSWQPDRVQVAPYRLYPVSTGLPGPVWAHRYPDLRWVDEGAPWCYLFGLGMTYLPLEVVKRFLDSGPSSADDTSLSQWHYAALGRRVPIHWDVRPVHLHY